MKISLESGLKMGLPSVHFVLSGWTQDTHEKLLAITCQHLPPYAHGFLHFGAEYLRLYLSNTKECFQGPN